MLIVQFVYLLHHHFYYYSFMFSLCAAFWGLLITLGTIYFFQFARYLHCPGTAESLVMLAMPEHT